MFNPYSPARYIDTVYLVNLITLIQTVFRDSKQRSESRYFNMP
jgi:hypothetical protein